MLFERGIDICHETVRLWWNRFGPMFAGEIRKKRVQAMRQHTRWRWHLDEVNVRIVVLPPLAAMDYRINEHDAYYRDLNNRWSQALRAAQASIPRPPYPI